MTDREHNCWICGRYVPLANDLAARVICKECAEKVASA